MQTEPAIVFKGLESSEAVEAAARARIEKLERFARRIISCTVVIDAPHQHHRNGRLYNVRIDVSIPGREIVVNRDPQVDDAHEDVYVALRDAFDAAERQVKKYYGQRRARRYVLESPVY